MSDLTKSDKSKKTQQQGRTLDLTIVEGKSKSITLNEMQVLIKRDKASLTPFELRQLEEAQQLLTRTATLITESVNVSAVANIIAELNAPNGFMSSVSKIIESSAKTHAELVKSVTAFRGQTEALASLQRGFVYLQSDSLTRQMQEMASMSVAVKAMFEDFGSAHMRTVKSLSIDIGSLTAGITVSKYETIGISLDKVTDAPELETQLTATQTQSVGFVTLTHTAKLDVIFSELQATKQELAEMKQMLNSGQVNQMEKITPADIMFQRSGSILRIGNYDVRISLSSKQARFTSALCGSVEQVKRKWDIEDVVFEAFGERIDGDEAEWIIKLRSYIHQLNKKIYSESLHKITDFFVLDGVEVYINPKYLGNL